MLPHAQWTRRAVLCGVRSQSHPNTVLEYHYPGNTQADTLAAQTLLELASSAHTRPQNYSITNGVAESTQKETTYSLQHENTSESISIQIPLSSLSAHSSLALNGGLTNRTTKRSPRQENKPHKNWGVDKSITDHRETESPISGSEVMDTSDKKDHLLVNGTSPFNGEVEAIKNNCEYVEAEATKNACKDLEVEVTKDEYDDLEVEATKEEYDDLEEDVDVVDVMEATNEDSDMEVDVGGPSTAFNVGFGECLCTLL